MKISVFIKNTAILVVTALVLRSIGIIFKIFLAEKIGSEGMGLYQLIFSVYMLAATFATSGISTAVTRLISENAEDKQRAKQIIKKAVIITLLAATLSALSVFFSAEFIAEKFIGDIRAVPALKILVFSLPFMGISSCIRGYFIANRKTLQPSVVQILEQFVRIGTVIFCIYFTADKGIGYSAAAVLFADTVAEAVSFTVNYIFYKLDTKGAKENTKEKHLYKKILNIAIPISGSSYMSSVLHTAENLLVPQKLAVFHSSKERSLELFGAVKSMAMPVLFFPASFLTSLSTMLIPEVTSANASGNKAELKKTIKTAVGITLILSIFTGTVFWFSSYDIADLLYHDNDVGFTIKILAPIVPFMYLESVSAGILKGLDQQVNMFKYNLVDSVLRIISVLLLLPQMGIKGYLLIMIVSNCFTSSLSIHRLCKVSGIKTNIPDWIIKPTLFGILGGFAAKFLKFFTDNLFLSTVTAIIIQTAVFFALTAIFSPSVFEVIKRKRK